MTMTTQAPPSTTAAKKTAPSRSTAGASAAAATAPGSRLKMIDQLQKSMLDLDLADSDDLREFCEAVRKLLHFLGVTVAMAAGQMKVHARRAAKEAADGGLTVRQRIVLRTVLRKVGRKLDAVADDCGDGAAEAVGAWSAMEEFIQDVEDGGDGKMTRQKRKTNARGSGFNVRIGNK
jgi:hypothetical protein